MNFISSIGFSQILNDGTQIQAKVKVDFHEKYGMKFVIEDIDPAFTFGQLELERQKTIERLQKEDRIAKNTLLNFAGRYRRGYLRQDR